MAQHGEGRGRLGGRQWAVIGAVVVIGVAIAAYLLGLGQSGWYQQGYHYGDSADVSATFSQTAMGSSGSYAKTAGQFCSQTAPDEMNGNGPVPPDDAALAQWKSGCVAGLQAASGMSSSTWENG